MISCLKTLIFFFFCSTISSVCSFFYSAVSLFFKLIFRSSEGQPFVSSGDYRFYLQHCGSTLYSSDEVFDQWKFFILIKSVDYLSLWSKLPEPTTTWKCYWFNFVCLGLWPTGGFSLRMVWGRGWGSCAFSECMLSLSKTAAREAACAGAVQRCPQGRAEGPGALLCPVCPSPVAGHFCVTVTLCLCRESSLPAR